MSTNEELARELWSKLVQAPAWVVKYDIILSALDTATAERDREIDFIHAALGLGQPDSPWKSGETAAEAVNHLRNKVANQAERIRYLEGATNHATGTPLSRALKRIDALEAAGKCLAAELCTWAPKEMRGDVLRKWDQALRRNGGGE